MNTFEPRLDILPQAQKRLWPELRELPKHFVLYGGTGLALRLGHRQSVDFDFFSSSTVDPEQLLEKLTFLSGAKVVQRVSQTLSVVVQREGPVHLSFFGGLTMGRVQNPERTADGTLFVASLIDLAGMKAAVVQKRAEAKDYIDLLALIENGIPLSQALGAAEALYPGQYNPILTLKALSYFGDGNLGTLTAEQKKKLIAAASGHFDIEKFERVSTALSVFNS
jgi:hypothetical protein